MEQYINKYENDGTGHYLLAVLYHISGKYDKSEMEYMRTIGYGANDDSVGAYFNLGVLYSLGSPGEQ